MWTLIVWAILVVDLLAIIGFVLYGFFGARNPGTMAYWRKNLP